MPYKNTMKFAAIFFTASLMACAAETEAPRPSAAEVTNIALADVPENVKAAASAMRADFTMTEVLRKRRDDRVYFDVEGELPNGDEIEFDILMTDAGPQVVEIQRDISWETVPKDARDLVNGASKDGAAVARIIESQQTEDGSIIYEVFIEGKPSDPHFEVQVKDGQALLLKQRAIH
ncbi:MAG: hypothetical protein ABJ275_04575 [Maricaulaceae bacterium]